MDWEIAWIIFLLIGTLFAFIRGKWPIDLTAIGVFSILVFTALVTTSDKWPQLEELLLVFSNPAPLTIAAMFILSAALEKCGAIESLANLMGKAAGLPYQVFLAIFILGVTAMSAFVNNTVVVVVLMPVVLGLARSGAKSPSKFLIPLSYASIFGGCCTAIGTSTNILASGLLKLNDLPVLGMFELGWIGLPAFVLGWLYLILFSDCLLPDNKTLTSMLSEEERREYLIEAQVGPDAPMIGVPLKDTLLFKTRGVRVIEVLRKGVPLFGKLSEMVLESKDSILLACRPSGLPNLQSWEGISLPSLKGLDLEHVVSNEGMIVEGIVGQKSSLIGQTIASINQNPAYRLVLLAVHRKGEDIRDGLENRVLEFGDILLLMGTDWAIESLRSSGNVLLLDKTPLTAKSMTAKQPWVLGVFAGIVGVAAFDMVPILGAVIIGVGLLLAIGALPIKDAYAAIDWRVLSLLYGMLGLGIAMEKSGFTDWFAHLSVHLAQEVFPVAWMPYVILAALYLGTMILTEVLSNNATIMLMGPIAINLAETLQLAPRPYVIAVCIASSAGFMIPTGYQTHTYVYGVGNYRFKDFLKIGWPLDVIYFVAAMWIVPRVWPLY